MFSRENILKPCLEIKASKLLAIMCKIFNNEKPKSKHKFLLGYANHVHRSLCICCVTAANVLRGIYIFLHSTI